MQGRSGRDFLQFAHQLLQRCTRESHHTDFSAAGAVERNPTQQRCTSRSGSLKGPFPQTWCGNLPLPPPSVAWGLTGHKKVQGISPLPSDSAGPWSAAQLLLIPIEHHSSPGPSALQQLVKPGTAAARLTLLQATAHRRPPLHAPCRVRPSVPASPATRFCLALPKPSSPCPSASSCHHSPAAGGHSDTGQPQPAVPEPGTSAGVWVGRLQWQREQPHRPKTGADASKPLPARSLRKAAGDLARHQTGTSTAPAALAPAALPSLCKSSFPCLPNPSSAPGLATSRPPSPLLQLFALLPPWSNGFSSAAQHGQPLL